MSDENKILSPDLTAGIDGVKDVMQSFIGTAGVDKVFAEPTQKGEVTIIPAAEVVAGLGFGMGYGGGEGKDENDEGSGSGGGGGGGGRIFSRPVGVIVISENSVRVEPVMDVTKVALAGITAFGFMIATLAGFLSPKEIAKNLKGGG